MIEAPRSCVAVQALDDFGDDEDEPFGDDAAQERAKAESIAAVVAPALMRAADSFSCAAVGAYAPATAVFHDDEAPHGFFLRCVRCLGSFSLVDACIVLLAERGVCALVVRGLRHWRGLPDVVACAMELLSNLAAIEDDEMDEQVTTRNPTR